MATNKKAKRGRQCRRPNSMRQSTHNEPGSDCDLEAKKSGCTDPGKEEGACPKQATITTMHAQWGQKGSPVNRW